MPALRRSDIFSRSAASCLALLTAVSIWLSAGVLWSGVNERIAALPSLQVLALLAVAAPAAAWLAGLRLEHAWPLAISFVLWLPFLGSSLIWEGPIEGIVWLLVIAGLMAARPPKLPGAFSRSTVAPWIAALFVAVASLVVFGQVRHVIPGGDEPHYLAATQSLLHDADLKVANNYEKGDYLEYFPGRLEPHFLKRSTSGDIYSIHAPGVSVILLPAFSIAGYLGAVWMMVLVAALTAALMWRLAFAVSGSPAAAWIGVAGVCFSAPYFFHTFTIYPEVIGGLCVLIGTWLLVELASGRDPETRTLIAVGAALAVLPWLHSRFAVLAGIMGLLIAARLAARPSPLSRIGAFLAVPITLGAAWFAFFYVIWGSPSPAAPYGPDTGTSIGYVGRGLIGLLFDQQFGVMATAPIYVMAAIGGIALLRARPRLAIELALIVIPYAIAVASYAMWWGGSAAPARFLVAILPLAALPVAFGYAGSQTFRAIALILVVVSAALLLPRAFEDNGRFIYNNRSGVDATVQWLSANYGLPAAVPSVHGRGGSAALREAFNWLAVFAIATTVVGVLAQRWSNGARFALAGLVLACSVGLRSGELGPDRERVMLERFRPSWQSTIVDLPSWNPTTVDALLNRLSTQLSGPSTALNRVPAGEYFVVAEAGTSAGSLQIVLGRNDPPLAQPTFDDLRNPQTPFKFRLPVMARTLNFRIAGAGPRDDIRFALQPVGIVPAAMRQPATRAVRFGHARAFFFDEWAYPERDGFWTRANGSATVLIDTGERTRLSGLPISITAGPVATTVRVSIGSWDESFALAAGQKRDLVLPPAENGAWRLRIQSGAGFRPSEREPGNQDVRELATWVAIH